MGLPSNTNALQNGFAQGYQIGRSLRFRSSASAYLNRTAGTPTNANIWTWSGWVKRGTLSTRNTILCGGSTNVNYICFNDSGTTDYFGLTYANTPSQLVNVMTTQVFRDPSAWYHLMVVYDSTSATSTITGSATDRVRLYVNGIQVNAFSATSGPTQNTSVNINTASSVLNIGRRNIASPDSYLDGYLAEQYFVDGQALTPSSFGLYDSNGIWQPKKYTGTYGTNGFYLPFNNTTSTTTLVADASGNGNNWTANNISLTSGATYDSMIDSPTNSNVGGNYCVLNPLNAATTLSNANLNSNPPSANWLGTVGTLGFPSGKFYYEATITATTNTVFQIFGAARSTISNATIASNGYPGATADGWGVQLGTPSYKVNNGTFTALGSNYSYTTNDVIMVAVDVDAGKFWYGKNGTWIESGNPATGTNALFTNLTTTIIPMIGQNTSGNSCAANFGQRPFTYTPPSGYNALNTANLPQPLISNGANYMAATLYTGNGTAGRVITVPNINEVGFAWVKLRSGIDDHRLANIVTGGNKHLKSNTTDAESTGTNIIQAFSSNTFTVGNDTSVNANGSTYVGWTWAANGTAVTNNNGTISSQVSANTSAGFSVVTYTGTGANATVGHGLGVAPNMIIWKNRSAVENWVVYHSSLGATGNVYLNLTNGFSTDSTTQNNTSPTSSVFTVATSGAVNGSAKNIVAYCFAAVSGYSAFGKYTGNGSTDGPFVYTGFRPRFLMIKRSTGTPSNWYMWDSSRSQYNASVAELYPNSSVAEANGSNDFDFLSNGFKTRNTADAGINGNGETFIYMAFAENPFQIARAR